MFSLCLLLAGQLAFASPAVSDVSVYLTTVVDDQIQGLVPQTSLQFSTSSSSSTSRYKLNLSEARQTMLGYGASMTEACAMNLNRLPQWQRARAIKSLFSKAEGAGFDYVRLPVGASDFSDPTRGSYSYNDTPGNRPDPNLNFFKMDRDFKTIEILQEAKRINPDLQIMISPWSPPAWMKTSNSMHGGSLLPGHFSTYARYFRKTIETLAGFGLKVDTLTVVNEPYYETQNYPTMRMEWQDQAEFINNHLVPELNRAGLAPGIFGFDHNWDGSTDLVLPLLSDATTRKNLSGVAYHCYGGNRFDMDVTMNAFPEVPTFQTECTGSKSENKIGDLGWWFENQSVGVVHQGVVGSLGWNMCLDEKFGPFNGANCTECRGLITTDFSGSRPKVIRNPEYYALAQVSRFMKVGAVRYEIPGANHQVVGFKNPDGSFFVVVENAWGTQPVSFEIVNQANDSITYTLQPNSAATFVWTEPVAVATTKLPFLNFIFKRDI